MADLRSRVRQLERKRGRRDRFAGAVEVEFSLWTDHLPEGTPVPEGARVVRDFYASVTVSDWGSRKGTIFRSGFERERLSIDAADVGRNSIRASRNGTRSAPAVTELDPRLQ